MDINTLVKTVKEYADKVKSEAPSAAGDSDTQIAVIVDAKGRIYSAVTSVVIKEGAVSKLSADYLAALCMINDGSRIAKSLAVAALSDKSIVKSSAECLELLFRTNPENDNCSVAVSDSEASLISALRLGGSVTDLMDGFDFDTEAAADTVKATEEETSEPVAKVNLPEQSSNVISGVKIEENNPFYESPDDVKPPEDIITTVSGDNLESAVLEKEAEEDEPELSKEELLKQAKKRKKVAKANFLFRKRH